MIRRLAVSLGLLLVLAAGVAPAGAQTDTGSTTTLPPAPSTTVELSAPVATSTPPTTTAPVTAAPVTTTAAPQVLGTQDINDAELALTGVDAGALAALGVALIVVGRGAVIRGRRD